MFLYSMVESLRDDKLKSNARHLAGILFKNTVLNTTKDEECHDIWYQLDDEQKEHLKDGLLESLGSDSDDVVRAAGSCISAVCKIEVPENRWLDVIDLMCKNAEHDDIAFRKASLLTLGYICEELSYLEKDRADYIITAFLESLTKNGDDKDLVKETIQGIYFSLKFSVEHFKRGQARLIMDNVIKACKYPSEKVRVIAMQCIVEIVRLNYQYIEPFMGDITETTFLAARKDETAVKCQAIEVWSSIAEEENLRQERREDHLGLINVAFEALEEVIEETIKDLNIGNEEIDEDQEWGTSVAAGCCLSLVSLVIKDKVVQPITSFVADNIKDERNWNNRY